MRCPDCTKFVSMEPQDPEVDVNVESPEGREDNAHITGTVRCVLACAECGTELKETTFDVDEELEMLYPDEGTPADSGHVHDLDIDIGDEEATETGGSRYKKNMRGYSFSYTIICKHKDCKLEVEGVVADALEASAWDETA